MLLVGIVRRPHGIAGEVSVEPATDFPERFVSGAAFTWIRGGEERALVIATVRPHADRLLVRFDGVDDGEAARSLAGGDLMVPDEAATAVPDDYFYAHEVEGWRCEDAAGHELGKAVEIARTAGGAMLLLDSGGAEPVAIPFVRPIVVSVDRDARRIVLDPPEGLLEL
ncbi:MAG TPA: ribosome maturation factor RimM [Thermoanaerobaculia bacterium]|nr:ribosome maturation factor RimM [Thermoanaerobaculia bacterium]